MNFQMFQLDLEKAEEPEIKLPTFTGSSEKQECLKETLTSALLTMPKPLTCGSQQTVENSSKDGNIRPSDLPPEKSVCKSKSNSQNQTQINRLVPNWEVVCQGCILLPYLFNLYAEYIMRNAGLDEAQAGVKIAGLNINNLRYADDTTLRAESEERTKEPLHESEKGE